MMRKRSFFKYPNQWMLLHEACYSPDLHIGLTMIKATEITTIRAYSNYEKRRINFKDLFFFSQTISNTCRFLLINSSETLKINYIFLLNLERTAIPFPCADYIRSIWASSVVHLSKTYHLIGSQIFKLTFF
jgi:hypothetical protein